MKFFNSIFSFFSSSTKKRKHRTNKLKTKRVKTRRNKTFKRKNMRGG